MGDEEAARLRAEEGVVAYDTTQYQAIHNTAQHSTAQQHRNKSFKTQDTPPISHIFITDSNDLNQLNSNQLVSKSVGVSWFVLFRYSNDVGIWVVGLRAR